MEGWWRRSCESLQGRLSLLNLFPVSGRQVSLEKVQTIIMTVFRLPGYFVKSRPTHVYLVPIATVLCIAKQSFPPFSVLYYVRVQVLKSLTHFTLSTQVHSNYVLSLCNSVNNYFGISKFLLFVLKSVEARHHVSGLFCVLITGFLSTCKCKTEPLS